MPYTVKKGDSLSKIAAALGLDGWRELYDLNADIIGSNPNLIKPGQTLAIPGEGTEEEAADEETTADAEDTGYTGPTGVPSGGNIYQINRPGQDPLFTVMYEWPKGSGKFVSYEFDSREQLLQIVGENHTMTVYQRSEDWYSNPDRVRANTSVDEVAGIGGSFSGIIDDVVREAAIEAGITDPTIIGQMAADPEMQEILAASTIEGWSDQRILAEQRKTKFWTETLYPGIENFYAGSANPEQDYRDYVDQVESTLSGLGYTKDADGTYRSTVKQMLDSNVDADTFTNMAPTYVKATQNEDFRRAFDEWASTTLGRNVTFDDWFDMLAGEGEVDLALAAERATIDYLSQQSLSMTGLDNEQIMRLSDQTNLTEDELRQSLQDIDDSIYNLYGRGLEKYGLTDDDIFAARTGVSARSGKTTAELSRRVTQALREEGLADDDKLTLYTAYSESSGAPNRPGLRANARLGA